MNWKVSKLVSFSLKKLLKSNSISNNSVSQIVSLKIVNWITLKYQLILLIFSWSINLLFGNLDRSRNHPIKVTISKNPNNKPNPTDVIFPRINPPSLRLKKNKKLLISLIFTCSQDRIANSTEVDWLIRLYR